MIGLPESLLAAQFGRFRCANRHKNLCGMLEACARPAGTCVDTTAAAEVVLMVSATVWSHCGVDSKADFTNLQEATRIVV